MEIANCLTCTYCDRPFGQYNPIVNSALQYINQKFRTISLLNELADNLFVTQEYLSRRFSKGVGISLNRYLTMKRVDALGNWLSDPLVLPLDDVTLVSFGDRYLEIFRKYCK